MFSMQLSEASRLTPLITYLLSMQLFTRHGPASACWGYGVQCLMDVFTRRWQARDSLTFLIVENLEKDRWTSANNFWNFFIFQICLLHCIFRTFLTLNRRNLEIPWVSKCLMLIIYYITFVRKFWHKRS